MKKVCLAVIILAFFLPVLPVKAQDAKTGFVPEADGTVSLYADGMPTDYTGLYNDETYGWWLVKDGHIDFSYYGIYSDALLGAWKITGGTIDFAYTGWYIYKNTAVYYIEGGNVTFYEKVEEEDLPDLPVLYTAEETYAYLKKTPAFYGLSEKRMLTELNRAESILAVNGEALAGKKIACLGDSITWGDLVNYPAVLAAKLPGTETYNYGIMGGTYSFFGDAPMLKMAQDIARDTDIIIVFCGVNDWSMCTSVFGDTETCLPYTFCGDTDATLRDLKAKHPRSQIVICTPLDSAFCEFPEFADCLPLANYVEAIIALAAKYDMPVIDFYHSGLLNSFDLTMTEEWMVDPVHPNANGYTFLGTYLAAKLITK